MCRFYQKGPNFSSLAHPEQDLKRSLLNGLAAKLSCSASGYGRGLRTSELVASRENIMAIESTQSDLPDFNSERNIELPLPCVNLPITLTCTA